MEKIAMKNGKSLRKNLKIVDKHVNFGAGV